MILYRYTGLLMFFRHSPQHEGPTFHWISDGHHGEKWQGTMDEGKWRKAMSWT